MIIFKNIIDHLLFWYGLRWLCDIFCGYEGHDSKTLDDRTSKLWAMVKIILKVQHTIYKINK